MGFDCGFDVYPRLEATAANKQTYKRFLEEIIQRYDEVYDKEGRRADGKVLDMPTNSDQSDRVNLWAASVRTCPAISTGATISSALARRLAAV